MVRDAIIATVGSLLAEFAQEFPGDVMMQVWLSLCKEAGTAQGEKD